MALEVRFHPARRSLTTLSAASLPRRGSAELLPSSIVDLPWKLVAGICRSLHSGEKIVALHSFDEESRSAGVHRGSTD